MESRDQAEAEAPHLSVLVHLIINLHVFQDCLIQYATTAIAMLSVAQVSDDQNAYQDALYTYAPLPRGEAFRFLVLEPGEQQDVLRCSLRTSTIADADYEAISYVWGTEIRDHNITCDGQLLKITKNLHDALTRLRTSEARSLWADSICIDQENVHEKTHQLACMGRIYAAARSVLVCMGPDPNEHAPKVSSLLSDLRKRFDDELAHHDEITWDIISSPSPDDPILHDERWSSLETFLHLPWCRRGWVVRETGLAKACEVVWGSSMFGWTDLMWTMCWLIGRDVSITQLPSSYFTLASHQDAYWDRHNDTVRIFFWHSPWQPNRLLDYLTRGRSLEFRDRRDSIFAFLDLATSQEPQLNLDYDQSPHKLFHDFAAQYILITGDVTILEYTKHGEQLEQSNLPTWVPSWDYLEADPYLDEVGARYGCSALVSAYGRCRKPEITHEKLLKVHGALFDTAESLSETFYSATTTAQAVFDLWCRVKEHVLFKGYSEVFLVNCFISAITRNSAMTSYQEQVKLSKKAYIRELLDTTREAGVFQCQHMEQLHPFHRAIQMALHDMKFMITRTGSIGLVPSVAREGDLCGIIFGCVYPCLLRVTQSDSSHQFLGSAHIFYFARRKGHITGHEHPEAGANFCGRFIRQNEDAPRIHWHVKEQDIYLC